MRGARQLRFKKSGYIAWPPCGLKKVELRGYATRLAHVRASTNPDHVSTAIPLGIKSYQINMELRTSLHR